MKKEPQLTIIVPVYNEEESLPRLKNEADNFLKISPEKVKILFVDDGSTDKSLSVIRSYCTENPDDFSFIALDRNQGLSAAIKAGIDHINTPYLGYIDADLQTSFSDFLLFYEHMDQFTMINGIRQKRADTLVKRLSSKIANGFRQRMIHDNIKDTCCPLKLIQTKTARELPFFNGMHRFIPALVLLHGGKVKQIPVQHFKRMEGVSKYNLWNRLTGPFIDTLAFMWMRKRNIKYSIKDSSHQQ
ncbi:glycosyltransferase family 2 protein [Marinilabilia sp.]|uniref:glycosyltransferase family 2 protein n=1 Tax=Marinilabilia sp. TaxID=2021252 RepID=UPI0025BFEF48|nr:glycosyltransferase family 2 protein [Marinilabilia sp.]